MADTYTTLGGARPEAPGRCPHCRHGNPRWAITCKGYLNKAPCTWQVPQVASNVPYQERAFAHNIGLSMAQASGNTVAPGDREDEADIAVYVLLISITFCIVSLGMMI